MPLTREMMREAGREAFKELKKYQFCESKTEGNLTTVFLFGDKYRFFIDSEKKAVWMKSQHHYSHSVNFKLMTCHKEWQGFFSFPREIAHNILDGDLKKRRIHTSGVDGKILGLEAKIVANQAYGFDKKKMTGVFGGFLWKHLDREIACLAMKVFGISSSSLDYSLIWNNKEEFVETVQKSPSILPVWRTVAFFRIYGNRKKEELPNNLGNLFPKFSPQIIDNAEHFISSFDYAADAKTLESPDIVKTTKEFLDSLGLTKSGWRFLLQLSPRSALTVMNCCGGIKHFVPMINWLAHVGVVPRYSTLKKFVSDFSVCVKSEDLTAFARAALRRSYEIRGVKDFYSEEVQIALDWFKRGGEPREARVDRRFVNAVAKNYDAHVGLRVAERDEDCVYQNCTQVSLDANQRRAPWDWFMRRQREWHDRQVVIQREQQRAREASRENRRWDSLLGEFTFKKYSIIPITNSKDLSEEGAEMRHCVGSYDGLCIDGVSRIFSLRADGKRVATLEIRLDVQGSWRVSQCRGVGNEKVAASVDAAAKEVAARYYKESKKRENK